MGADLHSLGTHMEEERIGHIGKNLLNIGISNTSRINNQTKYEALTKCFGRVGRGYPKPLCILFPDTKGIQWVDTDATHKTGVS